MYGTVRCLWILPLIAVLSFVLGNLAPPLPELLCDLNPRGPTKVAAQPEPKPPLASTPTELAEKWRVLRDATESDLGLAQNLLIVMRANHMPATHVQEQERKVHSLRDLRDLCDACLQELAVSERR